MQAEIWGCLHKFLGAPSSKPKPFSDSETIKDVVILYCIFGILLCGNKSISKMLLFFKPQKLSFSQNICLVP